MTADQSRDHGDSMPEVVSDAQLRMALDQLLAEQNLAAGTIAGAIAAVVAAGIWAVLTAVTEYQIGFMAIGVGFLVGIAMRMVGKGIEPVFGIVGAALSLIGCLIGNLLTMTWFIAASEGVSYGEMLGALTPALAVEIMTGTFDPMDLVFYGIAVYFGYKYSFTPLALPPTSRD